MIINCLEIFEGFNQFSKFSNFIEIEDWKIEKQLLRDRVVLYQDKPYFKELSAKFKEKKLSIWPLKNEEIITWIDTISLLRRLSIMMFKKGINTEKITIIMEYPLIFGNHMRSDYLFVYERFIIVLEFGMFNQDEKRSEERYTKKLQESINYRQILDNMLEKGIVVVNYVLIYKPEFNRETKTFLNENIQYNQEELARFCKFLSIHINNQNTLSAIEQLKMISENNIV